MSLIDRNSGREAADVAMDGPALPERNVTFEQHVSQRFQALQEQIDNRMRELAQVLPQQILDMVRPGLEGPPRSSAPMSNMTANTRQLDDLKAQIDDLTAKNTSLLDHQQGLETKIATLNVDLNRKNRETRKLHEIIIQSGQDETIISDEDVAKDFAALEYGIMRVAKKHFAASGTTSKWKQYHNLRPDDRDLCVRAVIADALYSRLFHPGVKVFGLDVEREKHQVELENKLVERKVPEAEITDWRIQTVKVARLMALKKGLKPADDLCDELCGELKPLRSAPNAEAWKTTQDDMNDLCEDALHLALKLRACRARYEWMQGVAPTAVSRADVDFIGPFNVHGPNAHLHTVRVLFGTVMKIVDGEAIVLRKGQVLQGSE